MLQLKKIKPKSDKVVTNETNKQTKQIFLPKIISEPDFAKSVGKVRFGHFKKMILLTGQRRCHQAGSSIFSGNWSTTQNGDKNRIYPSLTLRLQNFSLKKLIWRRWYGMGIGGERRAVLVGGRATVHISGFTFFWASSLSAFFCPIKCCAIGLGSEASQ